MSICNESQTVLLFVIYQETFYDAKSHTGYLEMYIRNRRSRDADITTLWKHKTL